MALFGVSEFMYRLMSQTRAATFFPSLGNKHLQIQDDTSSWIIRGNGDLLFDDRF